MGKARRHMERYHSMLSTGDRDGLRRLFLGVTVCVVGEPMDMVKQVDVYVDHYRIETLERSWFEGDNWAICEAVLHGHWISDACSFCEAAVHCGSLAGATSEHPIVQPWCEIGRVGPSGELTSLALYADPDIGSAVRLARTPYVSSLADAEIVNLGQTAPRSRPVSG